MGDVICKRKNSHRKDCGKYFRDALKGQPLLRLFFDRIRRRKSSDFYRQVC